MKYTLIKSELKGTLVPEVVFENPYGWYNLNGSSANVMGLEDPVKALQILKNMTSALVKD